MAAKNDVSEPEPPPVVYIHRVDTYFGRILAQQLGTSQPQVTTGAVESPASPLKGLAFLEAPFGLDCFNIIGSYRLSPLPDDPVLPRPDGPRPAPKIPAAQKLFSVDSETELNDALATAKIHIYHTLDENGENELFSDVQSCLALNKAQMAAAKAKKTVLLVSPLMTWCKTRVKVPKEKPKEDEEEEPEEEELQPLSEDEAKKRKPHPNFKDHLAMEKELLEFAKTSKRRVHAFIIGTGITYGYGEEILQFFFKDAWHNFPCLAILGDGKNQVPMIHVRDLAQVVQNVCDSRPKARYIVAVDAGGHTQKDLADGICKHLSAGLVISVSPETTVAAKKISQVDSDLLTADLFFEAKTVLDSTKIQWTAEEGFLKALPRIVKEYKEVRNLTPIKVAIIGPPFAGKTTMAKKIAEYYKLHYVSIDQVVRETEKRLKTSVQSGPGSDRNPIVKITIAESQEVEEGEEPEEPVEVPREDGDVSSVIQAAKRLLEEMEASRDENEGQLGDAIIVRLLREKLLSKPCQNQGYVLDGIPTSYGMARDLFAPVELDEEEMEMEPEEEPAVDEEPLDEDVPPVDKKLIPDYIFYMESPTDVIFVPNSNRTDSVLREHSVRRTGPGPFFAHPKMEEPDSPVGPTNESQFKKLLAEFAALNPSEQNVLTFFDEIENHAQFINGSIKEPENLLSFLAVLSKVGKPHNYGITDEEKKVNAIRDETVRLQKASDEAERKKKEEEAGLPERKINEAAWKQQLAILHTEECAKRELASMPVQQYLFKYVFPTIHEGLLQCARLLPSDPVDFLAEFLLQKSKPSNWSEHSRLFEPKKAENVVVDGAGDAPIPDTEEVLSESQVALAEDEQFLIAGLAHRISNRTARTSSLNFEFFSEMAHMMPKYSEAVLKTSVVKPVVPEKRPEISPPIPVPVIVEPVLAVLPEEELTIPKPESPVETEEDTM